MLLIFSFKPFDVVMLALFYVSDFLHMNYLKCAKICFQHIMNTMHKYKKNFKKYNPDKSNTATINAVSKVKEISKNTSVVIGVLPYQSKVFETITYFKRDN